MKSSHVGREDMKSGFRKSADLMSPRPPELGKAVEQDDERRPRGPRFGDVEADAADVDDLVANRVPSLGPLRPVRHGRTSGRP
jgi:hypothetical protein